jgi:aquaporin Z
MAIPTRIVLAEAIGTFVLVLGGPGSAVLATGVFTDGGGIGVLGVSLAFGLALLVMAYAIGDVSGCHINPAVTVGLWAAGKLEGRLVPFYVVAQVVGGIVAAGVIWAVASGAPGGFDPDPTNFAVNGWGDLSPGGFGFGAMAVAEIVTTALLVLVVLSTTARRFPAAAGGLAVGLTLTLIHLITIPVDNTSVNPARSASVAVFAAGDALEQLWAFVVFPLIGAVLGAVAWRAVGEGEVTEDVVLGPTREADVVDALEDDAARRRP